ncbi:hypothetical protein [Gordonia sp. CPCC 205333]
MEKWGVDNRSEIEPVAEPPTRSGLMIVSLFAVLVVAALTTMVTFCL